jgi:hypothetical protein
MKTIELPLSEFSFDQKLQLMETLWADLIQNKKFQSPDWHDSVVRDRQEAFDSGIEIASDWRQAKKRIKKNTAYE